jgi:hypothetical protein
MPMKSNSIETGLLLGAILFWTIILSAALLFCSVAVLWKEAAALMPRHQALPG